MRQLLRYYIPYRHYIFAAIVCNILLSVFTIVTIPALQPFLQILFAKDIGKTIITAPKGWSFAYLEQSAKYMIEQMILTEGKEKALLFVCIGLVGAFFLKNLFRYLALYFIAPVRNGIVRDFRQKLVSKLIDLPISYYAGERKGDLMSRITSDVTEVEHSIMGVVEAIFKEPIAIIGSISFMLFVSPKLSLFVIVLMVIAGGIIASLGRNLKRDSGYAQSKLGYLVSLVDETISGLNIIKGFNAERFQKGRFLQESTDYANMVTRLTRRRDLASPLSEFLGIFTVTVLLVFGARLVFNGEISPETFIVFLFAFYNVMEPAKQFSNALFSIKKGMGAIERIEQVLQAPSNITDAPNAIALTSFQHDIHFDHVSFQYDTAERKAVKNFNLTIPRGKIVALVGASGAGKSTISDLLPRFYDVSEGSIKIDGHDIRHLTLYSLRQLMGIVNQEAVLFNDSVWNNICFGLEGVTEAEVTAATKAANAHEFIQAMPQGYQTNIGDRGSKLSGGQRQRLTIARAILKNPPILILDEATSALDSESEKLVQNALEHLLINRTALVIAHRLSTIQSADHIVVMDAGQIIEQGTHTHLMANSTVYKRLVELQQL